MKFIFALLLITILVSSCVSVNVSENKIETTNTPKKPKNIILLIGDGMGLSQISASLYYQDTPSNFERFNHIGLIKTSAASDLITDSAASATSYATGIKTYNGAIGVDTDTIAIPTIVEQVSVKGVNTGLISTSSIVHATPASFYAHVKARRLYEDIAAYLPTSDIDFFAGGGLEFFNNRKDSLNLLTTLEENNFQVHTQEIPNDVSSQKQAILLAENGMPKMIEGRGDFLPNATKLALNFLSTKEQGFFLMIEGSQIDWGGHSRDADYLIAEQLDFDKTVGVALDFARDNPDTLIIVTADHETGGFTLAQKDGDYNKINPVFSTGGHSATMVPIFSKGPGAEMFSGVYENTEVYHKMFALFGL